MRRSVIIWSVIFGVFVVAFTGTVIALNSTLFSAGGFVRVYLDSLARQDVEGAMELPGVTVPDAAATDLLTADAMAGLNNIELISDTPLEDGRHAVTYGYTIARTESQTTFVVEPAGTVFGLFGAWRFAETPVTTLNVAVLHDTRYSANGVDVVADPEHPAAVLTPGLYVLDHATELLEADAVPLMVSTPNQPAGATVVTRATGEFVAQVQEELNGYLDDCATQRVLMPSGCPFGQQISGRLESEPQWSIVAYPAVTIVPGPAVGSWQVPKTDATAHLTVDVRRLFDGTLSTYDENVPFSVQYLITFESDGDLLITAQ
ncbi:MULTISPECIES: hypothetical protein [unclassified Diaminobutyricimonas]|uniref:hypothetical protein n=1 Tax=unclassified Diaminobutyricimonas TaxID=2643261 RepID=UPI0012F4CA54|nr:MULTISPECIES: hypothetical protein [unclassified Diaminobutyricimonas]